MRMNERMKKVFSILLCLCMLVQNAPVMAFAATTDNLCEHHTAHTAECGYAEAAAGSDCTHSHDASCGYAEGVAEVLCTCEATDENGALVHTEGCGYVAPVTGADCTHNHDEHCGYATPVEAKPCTYHCDICLGYDHDEEEQETTAPSSEATEPSSEATEPDPVCNCGTDGPAIHATTCAVYVRPENPQCFCAVKCTEVNEWCDICGFDISKCGGEDTVAAYDTITSGTCGDNLTWTYDAGTLTISGSGAMADYEVNSVGFNNAPWSAYITSITDISLAEGLTSIGAYAFDGCNSLTELVIPGSVKTIGNKSIAPKTNITVHYLGTEGSVTLGTSAVLDTSLFHYCENKEAIEATCVAAGHEAGWYCTSCQTYITGAATAIDPDNHNMVNGVCTDCDYECTHEEHAGGICTLCGVSGYVVSVSAGENVDVDVPYLVEKGKDCVAYITEEDGYVLTSNFKVLVGGTAIDDFYMVSGELTIPAEQITGDIEISASAEKVDGDTSNIHYYFGLPVFTWAEDHSCTATLTCARINCTHSETDTCTVTNEVTATSDCVTAVQTVYTATVTLNNKEFTDSKTVTGEKDPANHAKNTNTKYTPNEGDRTHSLICDQCKAAIQTGNHTFDETSTCTLCGYVCSHLSVHEDGCDVCQKPAVVFVANEEGASSYYCDLVPALSYGDAVASLLTDFTLTEDLMIPANMILDTDGHTLTVPEGMTLTNNGGLSFGDTAHYSGEKGTYAENDTATVKIGTSDGIIFENKLYYLGALCEVSGSDIIGINLNTATPNTYYPAGDDGYVIYEGNGTLRLYNAVITTPNSNGTGTVYAIYSSDDLTIYFSGNNYLTSGNTDDTNAGICVEGDLTLIAEGKNAALTVQSGNSGGTPAGIKAKSLTVNGGTVTVIGGSTDGAEAAGIYVETALAVNSGTVYARGGSGLNSLGVIADVTSGTITVAEGAALYATGGEAIGYEGMAGFSAGIQAATVSGNVNALGIAMSETEDAATIDYTVYGDLVLDKNVTISNPYAGTEAEDQITVTFIVLQDATLTVNSGVTLDLSTLAEKDIHFYGTITNNGTIILPEGFGIENAPESGNVTIGDKSYAWNGEKWICGEDSHVEGTPATCTTQAVCETCGEEYGDFAPDNHVQGCTLSYEVTEEGKHTGTYSLCKATFTKEHDFENAEHKCVCGVIETFQVFLFPDSLGMTTGTATFGVDFVQPITVPENTHLEIKGVYLDDDPSVSVSYTYENGILTIPAQGRPDGAITVDFFHYVEVTFHANGGVIKPEEGHPQDGWGYPEDGSYWIQKHGVSGYIHLANYAGMSRTGYTFKNEWQDENGTCYSHGDIASGAEVYSVYTDLTLYAQWQCLHTGEKNRTYVNMGTYHNYVETCAICGENTDRGVMVEHDYDETTHSCVCGAIETFTITFNPANGEEKIPITQDYGTPITAPELTYDGYHFVKWDTEVPETMPALDEELTITAVWEAHSGGEATCETKAVCEICGTSYGNLADHSTSYTADGMTITYKCATCDTQTVTFTLVIPNGAVYGSSGLEVPYYDCSDKAYNGELPMITLDGKELKDFVPNAGTYAVTMTWGGQTVSGEYTIAPKELTEEGVTITLSPDSFFYDGSEKLPAVTVKLGDKTLDGGTYADGYTPDNTTCDYRLGLPLERVKPGRWAITVLFMNNYSGDAVVHYAITIPEAILSPDTPNGENGWHKDASLLAPNNYAISTTKDGPFGTSLSLSDDTYESINYWLTYPDNANCEPVSLTWTGSIKMDGTAPTVSGTADSVTDSTASITVTADDALSGVASVMLTCTDASVTIGALTAGAFPVSGMHPNRAYTFTLTAKDEAGNEAVTTVELTTEKGDASVTKAPTANDLTYTGEAQPLLTAGVANGGTMQYSLDNQNWSADIPTGIDAKTYTVYYKVAGDSSHKDTVPASVAVTIAKANQEAPVGMTKTDEVIKGQKNGIITGLTNKMEYAVGDSSVYTAISGNQLENLAAGTYHVRFAADTNHNPSPDTEVTIAEGKPITVKFADGAVHPVAGHYTLPADMTGRSYAAAITQPTAPVDDTGDFVFLGWYTDAACADANAWDFAKTFDAANVEDSAFVQQNDHVEFTLYAKWKQIHFTISAGITDSDGNAYTGNVDIQLVQGNQEIESKTNVNSPVTFGKHVDAGMYNIIVTYTDDDGQHTKTELITVDHDETFTIKLPPAGANSHLTVSDNAQTPDVMVGGLDKEASDQKSGNDTVKVEMTVTGKTESQVADQVVNDVEEEVGDDTTVEYLDITVTKQVNNGTKTELSTTTNVLEIVVPYDGAGKDNLRVFRHHNGQLQEFVNGRDTDGTFFFEGGYIHIFTKYFSNYMITYDVSHQITFNANGGTVSTASAQTKGDGTLTSLPTPAREGYVFKGWYTAASGGTKVTTSYVFSGDATIYAQWSGYTVTVADASNGTVSVDRAEAPCGTQVTITVTPKSGYKMATVTVKDANGSSRAVSTDNNGKYYFTMPNANVTVTVTFSKISTSTADPTNPKTGDNFQLVLWSGIMCGSAICLLVAFADQKRKLIK